MHVEFIVNFHVKPSFPSQAGIVVEMTTISIGPAMLITTPLVLHPIAHFAFPPHTPFQEIPYKISLKASQSSHKYNAISQTKQEHNLQRALSSSRSIATNWMFWQDRTYKLCSLAHILGVLPHMPRYFTKFS